MAIHWRPSISAPWEYLSALCIGVPPPLVLTWACPNTATRYVRTFGSFLEASFLRVQSNRESGLYFCAGCRKGQCVNMAVKVLV